MPSSERGQGACIDIAGAPWNVDLARPHRLAIPLRPGGAQPSCFGAPPARATPLQLGTFSGAVRLGASCNCSTLSLTPHCDGTHTECVGHLTIEPVDVCDTLPHALLPALLVSLTPESLSSAEPCEPPALAGDKLITRAALLQSWPQAPAPVPRALIIRTRPNGPDKCVRDYQQQPAPYLTPSAARLLVERGIEHLVLDIPSADRADDGGRLSAHRVFFGLPPGSQALAEARRAHCTITELAFIPDVIADGCWLLALQVPRIAGDALPSQPLLYAASAA
jgi:kynurenine formamidase